jgi:glycosyltransferase involved in cell wall biosynthesis
VQPLLQPSQAILLISGCESLPVALLEAMTAGVVQLVRAIESVKPELVHHEQTGLLVGNDPAEAAAALAGQSRDPDLRQRCSIQSRALVEADYGANQCFGRWLGVMEKQRGHARMPFPIRTADLQRLLPLADPSFQS